MKSLILAATLLLSLSVQANDFCMDLSGGARAVMHVRQSGLSADIQHRIADQTLLGDDATILHMIIKDAYTQPVVADKKKAEQDFAVYWLLRCMKAQNGFVERVRA